MALRFEIWRSSNDQQYYWHVGSEGNGEILARSTDGYKNRSDCLHSIQLIREGAGAASVYDRYSSEFLDLD